MKSVRGSSSGSQIWTSLFNYVCDATLSVHPHQASWKVCLTTVGIEPATFGILVQKIVARAIEASDASDVIEASDASEAIASEAIIKRRNL
jgi:hypothetical protein